MLRLVLSIVAGLAVAFAIVFAGDALFHSLSTGQAPAPTDKAAMQAYVAGQPVGALVVVLAGWALAALAGAALASRLGRRGQWPGGVVTGLFLLATASNFVMVTHPLWMVVAAMLSIAAAGWLGARVGARSARPAFS